MDVIRGKRMVKKIRANDKSQMIALMGVVLAISVFLISSLAAEISNINLVASTDSSSFLPSEFTDIKETFGTSLNYNLIQITISGDDPSIYHITEDESILAGEINNILDAFDQTRNEYFNISLQQGNFFDARLNGYWYSDKDVIAMKPLGDPGLSDIERVFYTVDVTLFLDDGNSKINEDIQYLIVCNLE
jgi:hypothetical protein